MQSWQRHPALAELLIETEARADERAVLARLTAHRETCWRQHLRNCPRSCCLSPRGVPRTGQCRTASTRLSRRSASRHGSSFPASRNQSGQRDSTAARRFSSICASTPATRVLQGIDRRARTRGRVALGVLADRARQSSTVMVHGWPRILATPEYAPLADALVLLPPGLVRGCLRCTCRSAHWQRHYERQRRELVDFVATPSGSRLCAAVLRNNARGLALGVGTATGAGTDRLRCGSDALSRSA